MDVNSRNRTELKSYFLKNSIPTESNFAELIDGMLNQKDDGVVKLPGNPLSIEAAGDDNSTKKVINFYRDFNSSQPDWVLNLNSSNTAKPGFNISDGAGNSRIFIDSNNGNIGIGTDDPSGKLTVFGVNEDERGIEVKGSVGNSHIPYKNGSVILTGFNGNDKKGDFIFRTYNGSDYTRRFSIDGSTGHVGIGTDAGNYPFHITAIDRAAQTWQARFSSRDTNVFLSHYSGNGMLIDTGNDNTTARYGLQVKNKSTTHLYVRDDGNVGIGTNKPNTRLDVNGDTNINGTLRFADNTSQTIFGAKRANKNTVVMSGHWDELEVKGRIIEWTGSNFHLGYENDHSNDTVFIGNGKLKQVEIQGDTDLVVGGTTTTNSLTVSKDTKTNAIAVVGNRAGHWNTDGAIYRLGGQMFITVDDNLYIRDSGGKIKFHFDTNNGIIQQQGWQTVNKSDFKSNWVNYGGGYNPAGYFKDSMGIVHLRGLVKDGNLGNGETIFVLPDGYRPTYRELQVICRNSHTAGRVDILSDGRVIPTAGDSGWFSLDGVTFRAK